MSSTPAGITFFRRREHATEHAHLPAPTFRLRVPAGFVEFHQPQAGIAAAWLAGLEASRGSL